MWQTLQRWDFWLLKKINIDWSNPLFDACLPWLRYKEIWYPFYLFIIAFALLNIRKNAIQWVLMAALSPTIADLISSQFIKKWVMRLRPCSDPEISQLLLLRLPKCAGGYSFTSSHAATHFAIAAFLYFTLHPHFGRAMRWLFVWASAICYAQMYVGVHYPSDIVGGALVGLLVGALLSKIWHQFFGPVRFNLNKS